MKTDESNRNAPARRERRKYTRDEKLAARAAGFDAKAKESEAVGRLRWADIYRERAKKCRDQMTANDGDNFRRFSEEAERYSRLAAEARKRGDSGHAGCLEQFAKHHRDNASGFDTSQFYADYRRKRASSSVGLNQEALEILTALHVPRREFGRVLGWIVGEALCALDDARASGESEPLRHYRLTASYGGKSRSEERCTTAREAEACAQYQLARATFAADK